MAGFVDILEIKTENIHLGDKGNGYKVFGNEIFIMLINGTPQRWKCGIRYC
jgi:hypothetical protein